MPRQTGTIYRHVNEAELAIIVQNWPKRSPRWLARELKMHETTLRRELARLQTVGALQGEALYPYRRWTPEERRYLEEHFKGRSRVSVQQAADFLNRSVDAVNRQLAKQGITSPGHHGYERALSCEQVFAILGRSTPDGIAGLRKLCQEGTLRADVLPYAYRTRECAFAIFPEALTDFLQRHPELYDKRLMPREWCGRPNPYLVFARQGQDPTRGMFTITQAVKELSRFGITEGQLREWIRHGHVRTQRFEGTRYCRKSEHFLSAAVLAGIAGRLKQVRGRYTLDR